MPSGFWLGLANGRHHWTRLEGGRRQVGVCVPLAISFAAMALSSFQSSSCLSHQGLTILPGIPWHSPPLVNIPLLKDSSIALFEGNTSFLLKPQMMQEVWRLGGKEAPTNAHHMVVQVLRGGRQKYKVARPWTLQRDLLQCEFSPQLL